MALLRVAYCAGYGSVMYQNKTTTAGKVYTYYECKGRREGNGCTEKKIHAEVIEDMLESALMNAVGNDKTRTKKVIPASDNTA